ncbi:MAG: M67 family metallopeptidase [Oscillospiraceae bacterium]|jgi:proteasome lid subunit RPN8/RPN11|nr:M67 family metallopeptidase [Oscillospiraceae bacterium]
MLYMDDGLKSAVEREGEKAYPNECCGVLFGEVGESGDKRVRLIEPIVNSHEESEKYHRFLITPDDVLAAELKARSLKFDVLGFYHSHPDCPAEPSDYDREHALPFYSYVITSVNKGEAKDFKSWELVGDRSGFIPEEVKEG